MKELIINSANIRSVEDFHKYIKESLDLPSYYGENLDALWDVLSSYSDKLRIVLTKHNLLVENLGQYGEDLIDLFHDLKEENDNIELKIS